MDWIQVFTIIGVLGGFMFFMLQRLEKDIGSLDKRMDGFDKKMDAFERRMDSHAQRIDQLYKMFVDLLKEKKS